MRRLIVLIMGLAASVSARCGTPPPSDELRALHAVHAAEAATSKQIRAEPLKMITITTYCHIVPMGDSVEEGNLAQDTIIKQIAVLNQRFKPHGFVFKLSGTTRTVNKDWNNQQSDSPVELTYKSKLRQGKYKDLNLYFTKIAKTSQGNEVLGYATFPEKELSDKGFKLDGVVLDPEVAPGGRQFSQFTEGITAVHEVGHWLSLFHTFEAGNGDDGCVGQGDFIADTPAEESPASGCPEGRDTCDGSGLDPIHNYMDYTDDDCLTTFTHDQTTRMRSMYEELRDIDKKISASGEGGETDPTTGNTDIHRV